MSALITFWRNHGTKLLGTLASIVSTAMLIPELIPAGHLKYWLFANALLGGGVVKRGFQNSKPKPVDEPDYSSARSPWIVGICAAILAASLGGCATLEKHETSAKLVTQYATLKYLGRYEGDERQVRAERIRAIASDVRDLAQGEATLALLRAAVASELDGAGLSPADRLLADGLVDIIVAELEDRIGAGVLSPEQSVQVAMVLDWVVQATQMA